MKEVIFQFLSFLMVLNKSFSLNEKVIIAAFSKDQ